MENRSRRNNRNQSESEGDSGLLLGALLGGAAAAGAYMLYNQISENSSQERVRSQPQVIHRQHRVIPRKEQKSQTSMIIPLVVIVVAFLSYYYLNIQKTTMQSIEDFPSSNKKNIAILPPTPDFAQIAIEGKIPVLVQNSKVIEWPALKKWTPEYFEKEMPTFKVHVSSSPIVQMCSIVQPFGSLPNVEWKRPWTVKDIKSVDFFSGLEHYYFMSHLEDLPKSLAEDIPEISFLGVEWRPIWEANLWMGIPPITTPIHYDVLHNFYVQIHGNKRFFLFPPSDWPNLYLYPRLHPSTRMSQVNFKYLDKFPGFESTKPIEIVLNPGDVLYIPPYWFHHVTAMGSNVSMSISIHSHSEQADVRENMNNIAPQINKFATLKQKIDSLALYLIKIFNTPQDAKDFVNMLIQTRYSHFEYDTSSSGLYEIISNSRNSHFEQPEPTRLHEKFVQDIENTAKIFRPIIDGIENSSELQIELANYIEDITNYILSNTTLVDPFLRNFVR